MAASARLIVLMDPAEKAALDAAADSADVSTAEFVRRRLFGYETAEQRDLVQILAAMEPLAQAASDALDACLAEIRALRDETERRDRAVADEVRRDWDADTLRALGAELHLDRLPGPDRPTRERP